MKSPIEEIKAWFVLNLSKKFVVLPSNKKKTKQTKLAFLVFSGMELSSKLSVLPSNKQSKQTKLVFLVFSGMELSGKLSKNSFEISTKREAAAIVLVGFQNRRISLLEDYY